MKDRNHLSQATKAGYRMGKDHAHLLVFELVKDSKPLECYEFAKDMLEIQNASDRAPIASRLQALGRCIAADVFLNNSDRCPVPCWDNEGNAGNLMLPTRSGEAGCCSLGGGLIAID